MRPAKKFRFEGKWQTISQIAAQCPAYSRQTIARWLAAGAACFADFVAMDAAGRASRLKSARRSGSNPLCRPYIAPRGPLVPFRI